MLSFLVQMFHCRYSDSRVAELGVWANTRSIHGNGHLYEKWALSMHPLPKEAWLCKGQGPSCNQKTWTGCQPCNALNSQTSDFTSPDLLSHLKKKEVRLSLCSDVCVFLPTVKLLQTSVSSNKIDWIQHCPPHRAHPNMEGWVLKTRKWKTLLKCTAEVGKQKRKKFSSDQKWAENLNAKTSKNRSPNS